MQKEDMEILVIPIKLSKPLKLCFVSDRAYRYLDPSEKKPAGGAQRQQYLLASELRDRGHGIGFIVGDYGQPREQTIDEFTILKGCPQVAGSPISILQEFARLFRAVKRANAGTYYVRGAPRLAISTALCCRLLGKRFVFCAANDADVKPEALKERYGPLIRMAYRGMLDTADVIIAQSTSQARHLCEHYGQQSHVIPNGYHLPPEPEVLDADSREYILWVGSSDPKRKRPDQFLKLAEATPDIDYVMISQPVPNTSYQETLEGKAESIPNLSFEGAVDPSEIHDYYRRAELLVNTSAYEGFPNTFLEAWRYATPVVSLTFDLDGLLGEGEIGVHSGTMEQLIRDVAKLHADVTQRGRMGKAGRKHLKREYALESVADQYETVLDLKLQSGY